MCEFVAQRTVVLADCQISTVFKIIKPSYINFIFMLTIVTKNEEQPCFC